MIFCPKTSKLFGFLLKVLQPIGKTLVRLNHCPHLLEHPCLNGKPLPHHRVEPGADCALHSQVIPHTGDFGRQALDLPTEKFECDRIALRANSLPAAERKTQRLPVEKGGRATEPDPEVD